MGIKGQIRYRLCSELANKLETLSDKKSTNYSFLSRYHHTKSKNHVQRRYQNCY